MQQQSTVPQGTAGVNMGERAEPDLKAASDRRTLLSVLPIVLLIVLALFLKFHLWFQFLINADEFHFLEQVHSYGRGELTLPFQTFHVHFFQWLGTVSDNEVTQVMRAREVMTFLFLGACVFLFLLGRYLYGLVGAAFAVLCYLSLLFTIGNGASFRPDTLALCPSLLAVYLFVAKKESWLANALAGLAMALACLFTIKASLYLGLLVPLAALRLATSRERTRSLARTACFAVAFLAVAIGGYALHAATLSPAESARPTEFFHEAFSIFIALKRLSPGMFFLVTLSEDAITWLLLALGFSIGLVDLVGRRHYLKDHPAYLLAMSLPLLSVLVYRNTFPYYYAFMMPPVILLCGYAFSRLATAVQTVDRRLAAVVMIILPGAVFLQNYTLRYAELLKAWPMTAAQREVLAQIHEIFPQPVPYLDCPAMVASFPQVGFFMGSKGVELYLKEGRPVLSEALRTRKPVFLLANAPYLDLHPEQRPVTPAGLALVEEDWIALKSYFIHHWGPVWVVGKQFDFAREGEPRSFEIITPGTYTLEADGEVQIDGTVYHQGEVLGLEEGSHTVKGEGAVGTVRLRWGDHLYCPSEKLDGPLFLDRF